MEDQSMKVDATPPTAAAVAERFLKVEDKYFFADQTLAFRDRGSALETTSNNLEVVRSLIAIAEARNWGALKVTGSSEFRRAVWREASLRGIDLSGYRPTALEQAEVRRTLEHGRRPTRELPTSKRSTAELAARAAAVRDPAGDAELTVRYPDLAVVARALRASERLMRRIENEQDRVRVAALIREKLAQAVERGEDMRAWLQPSMKAERGTAPIRDGREALPVRG